MPPGRRRFPASTATRWWKGCARGHRAVVPLPGPEHLAEMVHAIAKSGDFVVCLGAGTITNWAAALPGDLAALQAGTPQGGGRRAS